MCREFSIVVIMENLVEGEHLKIIGEISILEIVLQEYFLIEFRGQKK
jgi:hypothetical protein